MTTNIEIIRYEECGYTVSVNGEVLLECLGEDELNEISISEVLSCYKQTMTELAKMS